MWRLLVVLGLSTTLIAVGIAILNASAVVSIGLNCIFCRFKTTVGLTHPSSCLHQTPGWLGDAPLFPHVPISISSQYPTCDGAVLLSVEYKSGSPSWCPNSWART